MREKPKGPFIPPETHDTIRQAIVAALLQGLCTAKDLSAAVKISEREVDGHLEHIRKSLAGTGQQLLLMPAECKKCGFVFSKRDKFKRPGKCPVCRGESIREPRFTIEKKR